MVVIRLTRTGKKKQAFYRIVAADSRRFVNSKFIEILGWYNPKTKEISLKADRVADWLSKGAQPSNTVAKLLKDNSIKLPEWVTITAKNRKPKKEPIVKEVKEVAPVAEEVAETPAEEVAPETTEEVTEEAPAEETAPEVVEEVTAEEATPEVAEEVASEEAPTE